VVASSRDDDSFQIAQNAGFDTGTPKNTTLKKDRLKKESFPHVRNQRLSRFVYNQHMNWTIVRTLSALKYKCVDGVDCLGSKRTL